MKRSTLLSAIACSLLAMGLGIAPAQAHRGARTLQVAITNVTRGQIVSPPILVTHRPGFALFEPGEPAADTLAALAEDGDALQLAAALHGDAHVFDVVTGDAPIPPGETVVLEIRFRGRFNRLSAAGMLVTTNDAFFALNGAPIAVGGLNGFEADAYDAGTEANTEACAKIPGPPCGNGGQRDTAGGEGFVHIHGGIHGVGDLPPAAFDWHNPVVKIRVLTDPF